MSFCLTHGGHAEQQSILSKHSSTANNTVDKTWEMKETSLKPHLDGSIRLWKILSLIPFTGLNYCKSWFMVFSPLNNDLSGLLPCDLIKAEDMNLHYIVPVLNAKTFDNFNFQLAEFFSLCRSIIQGAAHCNTEISKEYVKTVIKKLDVLDSE